MIRSNKKMMHAHEKEKRQEMSFFPCCRFFVITVWFPNASLVYMIEMIIFVDEFYLNIYIF